MPNISRRRGEQFLDAGTTLSFAGTGRKEIYALLRRAAPCAPAGTQGLSKKDKGVVRRYLAKMQRTQPVANHPLDRPLARARRHRAARFRPPPLPTPYTPDDIARLARSTRRTKASPARPGVVFSNANSRSYDKADYQRLASISASHIYNLRRTRAYREHARAPHQNSRRGGEIGERRKPDPRGRPGYLRVDTVHSGRHRNQQGAVSHQRRRHGHAMAGGGLLRNHLRGPFASRF